MYPRRADIFTIIAISQVIILGLIKKYAFVKYAIYDKKNIRLNNVVILSTISKLSFFNNLEM